VTRLARRARRWLLVLAVLVATPLGCCTVDWIWAGQAVDALADAAWIVELDGGIEPEQVVPPSAGTPYGPGSPEIDALRSMAQGLERLRGIVVWKGQWHAVVGTTSGERLHLQMSYYGGFFLVEDGGYRFSVAPDDRETWERLFTRGALPKASALAGSR
jgi:hypothetical protein